MANEAFQRVLALFPNAKRNGKGYIDHCPAHDDRKPSLSITEGDDGRALLHCHAGCDTKDVVAAKGKTMADLMPSRFVGQHKSYKSKQLGHIVNTYPYVDEDGSLLFEVVRFEPKEFRQRRPNGDGSYIWNLDGVRRVLYRLPQILAAGDESFIFVVEGEKDVDRLEADGLIATTNPGGAGNWHLVDDAALHGRHVVVIPDNHKQGRDHATDVANSLHGKAASVRVLELPNLPEKGDVSDWLDAGNDPEELVQMAEAAPLWTPTAIEHTANENNKRRLQMRRGDTIDDENTRYLWKQRITLGSITVIFSRPSYGKSTLGADLTAHVTCGKSWPDGSPCPQGEILYFKGEGTDASVRDRMSLAGVNPTKYHLIGRADGDENAPMIDLAKDVPLIANALEDHPATKLIIVDTLDSLFTSMRMIDNTNIRRCLWALQELAEEWGIAVVIFAHTNKGGYADPLDRLSGGRAIGAAARSVWYLGKTEPESQEHFFANVKANDFAPAKTLKYQIVGSGPDTPPVIRWGGEVDVSSWDLDRPPKASERDEKAKLCQEWLADRLADRPTLRTTIAQEAKQQEFGDWVMRKVKTALGVETKAAKGQSPPVYYVCLPGQEPPNLAEIDVADGNPIPLVLSDP